MSWRVDVGDCVELMAAMDASSVDAVVCDPPYGLEFMGKEWDRLGASATHRQDRASELGEENKRRYLAAGVTFGVSARSMQAWHEAWAAEALRVLKPGGHLLAFGGTRTSHRLACAIEDAGFEIRDTICWLYGSGFPKSLDVGKAIDKADRGVPQGGSDPTSRYHGQYRTTRTEGKRWDGDSGQSYGAGGSRFLATTVSEKTARPNDAETADTSPPNTPAATANSWDGWGTALKPAHEPIVVARKPLAGTVAANVLEHGTGALNIDGGRVGLQNGEVVERDFSKQRSTTGDQTYGDFPNRPSEGVWSNTAGRWPPNVALDQEAAEQLDRQSGELRYGGDVTGHETRSPQWIALEGHKRVPFKKLQDSGGASRFMYVAKASRAERNAGLDGFEKTKDADEGYGSIQTPILDRSTPRENWQPHKTANHHPTVKPVSLMRWLCRLVTPPGGLILDPFTGSGTTGIAAVLEGFPFAGCEQDADYAAIAEARIGWWELHGHDALRIVAEQEAAENERQAIRASGQLDLLTEG